MAVIRGFTEKPVESRRNPTEVDATWCRIESDGEKLLHIATYGSDQRMSDPKVSQVFQMDRERASELKRIIERVFPES